ncbi:hypothetical protein ABPG75_010619 [Micractinium tetrahymenae]
MLGFTLPLFIILGLEGLVGVLLLCPKPLNQPAIKLARLTHTQVGSTVFHTVAGVLALLLASPIYDGVRLYYSTKDKPEQANIDLRQGLCMASLHPRCAAVRRSDHEARTLLSFSLTGASLFMMFMLRALGRAQGELDRMSMSEAALLKQVKGLQSEYTRMVDSAGGASAKAPAAPSEPSGAAAGAGGLSGEEVAELRRLVGDLEEQNSKLQASLATANKEHAAAESNLAALKTQCRGLENEYDRLLAELDEAKRQLSRAGLGAAASTGPMDKKDA